MIAREAPRAWIKLAAGGGEQTWPLAGKRTYRLGRGEGCDIRLPFPWVSRQHAMLQLEAGGRLTIVDLGSANGTFVNGRRVYTPTRLNSNDRIRIGSSELIFLQEIQLPADSEEESVAAGDETVAFLQKNRMTILVCDIRGFTALAEEIGAGRISTFLARWTREVAAVIRKNSGQVDKFIGDAVLAVWPGGADFTAVARALQSAVEISLVTARLGLDMDGGARELKIGAAVNTGEAVMGNIGVDGQRDYTIVGDAVNVAFRLQEITSQRKVDLLLGYSSFLLLKDAGGSFSAGEFTVRGKAVALPAYSATFVEVGRYLLQWQALLKNP